MWCSVMYCCFGHSIPVLGSLSAITLNTTMVHYNTWILWLLKINEWSGCRPGKVFQRIKLCIWKIEEKTLTDSSLSCGIPWVSFEWDVPDRALPELTRRVLVECTNCFKCLISIQRTNGSIPWLSWIVQFLNLSKRAKVCNSAEESYFHCLYLWLNCFSHYPQLVTIGEDRKNKASSVAKHQEATVVCSGMLLIYPQDCKQLDLY